MKKRILAAVLGIVAVMAVSACGKSEKEQAKEYYQEELGLTEEEAEEIADFVYNEETTPTEAPEEEVPEEVELEHFPLSPEWKDYTISDGVFQIDDTVYYNHMLVSDFIDRVNASAVDYTYEYNPDKLVTSGHQEQIDFYREDQLWFSIYADHFFLSDGSVVLSDVPVSNISISDKAYEYCYFMDGRSYEELIQMNYNDVKDLADTVFADENFEDAYGEDIRCSNIYPEDKIEKKIEERIKEYEEVGFCQYREKQGLSTEPDYMYQIYGTPNLRSKKLTFKDPNWKEGDGVDAEQMAVHQENYEFTVDINTSQVVRFRMY